MRLLSRERAQSSVAFIGIAGRLHCNVAGLRQCVTPTHNAYHIHGNRIGLISKTNRILVLSFFLLPRHWWRVFDRDATFLAKLEVDYAAATRSQPCSSPRRSITWHCRAAQKNCIRDRLQQSILSHTYRNMPQFARESHIHTFSR